MVGMRTTLVLGLRETRASSMWILKMSMTANRLAAAACSGAMWPKSLSSVKSAIGVSPAATRTPGRAGESEKGNDPQDKDETNSAPQISANATTKHPALIAPASPISMLRISRWPMTTEKGMRTKGMVAKSAKNAVAQQP